MLCGLEGNRRSGVALSMCHGLGGLSTYGLNGQRMADEHPASAPVGYGTFTFILLLILLLRSTTTVGFGVL